MLLLLTIAELLFAALLAVGVGLIYLPAGLIVAGILGVLACEWQSARLQTRRRQQQPERGE